MLGLSEGESWVKGSGVIRISPWWGFREPGGKLPWIEAPKEAVEGLSRTGLCDPLRSTCQGWRLKMTSDRRCQVLSDVSSPCVPFLPLSFPESSDR